MSATRADPLAAHSLTEAELYLLVVPCARCRQGPLERRGLVIEEQHIDCTVRFDCVCRACGDKDVLRFRIDSEHAGAGDFAVLNPTQRPSRLIDVTQWLTIHHALLERAASAPEKQTALSWSYRAAVCLEEALKFFEPDNDLPPAEAFFSARSRRHAAEQPQLFTRQKLLELRSRLPNLAASPAAAGRRRKARKWWKFWQIGR